MNKDVQEAIAAANRAIQSLEYAHDKLDDAGGWGLFDLFGGGIISGMMKHSRIDEANVAIEQAKRDLAIFQDELDDIPLFQNVEVGVEGFATFADFFFDGFLADMYVQSKIRNAQRDIEALISEIQSILNQLYTFE